MSDLYKQGEAVTDIGDSPEDVFSVGSGGNSGSRRADVATGGAALRAAPVGRSLKGRGPVPPNPAKFSYDVVRGRAKAPQFHASSDDRMTPEEGGRKLDEIHGIFNVSGETEDVLYAFDCSLFFCHTINGASVLGPGRAKFGVPGVTQMFDYSKVRDILSVDIRRFFRCYADEIRAVNKRVLETYDPYDHGSAERWGLLMQVAQERDLVRYPDLCHDSAEACTTMDIVERQAVMRSKKAVVGATPNSADRMRAPGAVQSADGFDSSVGEKA